MVLVVGWSGPSTRAKSARVTTSVEPATLLNRPDLALFLVLHAFGLRLASSAGHGGVVAQRGPASAEAGHLSSSPTRSPAPRTPSSTSALAGY
ncbi:hypothetical protein [Amycolatopsis sp. NPDC059657]|uniref:hypothetical protein n=1 Tax=Amycolatopsis sp. NPDC059657 TaxID=3346899 RepID=UPI00366E2B61